MQRWCLICDGDSRTYLCPVDKRDEALEVLGAIGEYWARLPEGQPPELPTYLVEAENPFSSLFSFADPVYE